MLRFDTPTAQLRSVALLEGTSYLLLLFIAMPLKHFAGHPMPVRLLGSLHGFLFCWLMLLLLQGMRMHSRSFGWAFRIGLASLIPFGTYAIDGRLRDEDQQYRSARASGEAN